MRTIGGTPDPYCLKFGRILDLNYEMAWIRNLEDRFRHTYILGTTGTGKTTLLLNMALYDINYGLACIFIDPKGEHARQLYSLIPDKSRVTYFSYKNPAFVINPLRKAGYRLEDLIDEFIEILDIFIKQTSPTNPPASENMKEVLTEAITVLREEDRNIDFLYHFLRFEEVRSNYLKKHYRDDWPLYWKRFDQKDKFGRPVHPQPVETAAKVSIRLQKFKKDERFKRMTSGPNELDIARIANNKEVVIVDTSEMGFEKRVYITALFSFAVKSYCEFQKQEAYQPLMFYLDECWMGINASFEYVLSFGRSFKTAFTLAHQGVNQFDSIKTLKKITSVTNTKVGYLAVDPDEAKFLADTFSLRPNDFMKLGKYEAWVRILNQNTPVRAYPPPKIEKLEEPPCMDFALRVDPATENLRSSAEQAASFLREGWFPG